MALPGNLSLKRLAIAIVGAPLLGGFVWGALNPPHEWESIFGRLLHGLFAAPGTVLLLLARPDKLQGGWLWVTLAFVLLVWLAIRVPRERPRSGPSR